MKKYMLIAHFEDGTVDLCTVIEDKNQTNGCTFYRVIPSYGNVIMKDENFVACDSTDELLHEYRYMTMCKLSKIELKEMNT